VAEEQAVKEIVQELALYGLWRAGFFEVAAFQGGTSLRILHGLPRFSEDLDFILKTPDPEFCWDNYLHIMLVCLREFGMQAEALDKSRMDQRIRRAVLKDSSVANQLDLSFYRGHANQKLKIKLEIDIEPPAASGFVYSYLDFPLDFEVCQQDLPSNFALKIHALLCRDYIKGRDWYDFSWYVRQDVAPNLPHLSAALNQFGPWAGENRCVDLNWVQQALASKIQSIDWLEAAADVQRFLTAPEQASVKLWGAGFFTSKVQKLAS
jgi:predicted nucleotidyltransferase component of viral defense system